LESEVNAKGVTIDADVLEKLAYDLARDADKQLQKEPKMTPNLTSFTKFEGNLAPDSYLHLFED
jgi:hypothetical protein